MVEFVTILTISVALSMDTFSLSLGVGTMNLSKKKSLELSIIVGIMHFIMPLLGILIGTSILRFFQLNSNLMLGMILIFLAGQMLYDLFL